MRNALLIAAAVSAFAAAGHRLATPPTAPSANAFHWDLPPGFPLPLVPADNPMNPAKVQLGRYLFYDRRISVNGTMSCATCHRQELAFTDGLGQAIGATGQRHPRGSMSLVNIAYSSVITWSHPTRHRIEEQAVTPPAELGMDLNSPAFLDALRSSTVYAPLFAAAFPGEPAPVHIANVMKALAAFQRTIISARSPYDRYHLGGDLHAISESAQRGEALFWDPRLACFRCHSGINFSDATTYEGAPTHPAPFHNTGLYNLPGTDSYPALNLGLYRFTNRRADIGKFKTPTLRNIAVTAPYMHDGSVATLEDVLDHYAAGGRTIATGPYAGSGHDNPNKDPLVRGFWLTPQNRADLLAFLRSLTDEDLPHDPRFANPW